MRLRVITPLSVVVDEADVMMLRAEDASGGFGIMPGHAMFLTALAISVLNWAKADGRRHFCAVRGGVLAVTATRDVEVATREAIPGDDLATLDQAVLDRFRSDREDERTGRAEDARLQLNAIRQIMRHLRVGVRTQPGAFT